MALRTPALPAIPTFALYGEPGALGAEMLHIEPIQSRSKLYRWEIEAHAHRGLHQIVWLHAGPAEVWLDEARQRCAGPLAIVIPPGAVHAFRFAPESDGHVLTLSPRLLVEGDATPAVGDALRALFARPQLLQPSADEAERIEALFRELAAECRAPGPEGTPVPLWLARALVWRLARIGSRQDASRGPGARTAEAALFTRFVVLIEAHFLEHWPLSRYASRLGLTPERLNRLARAEAGRSALALVHDRLAREACRRVVYVAAPISRIADELGFDDPAYFCRFFKRHAGASPRAYRAAQAAGKLPAMPPPAGAAPSRESRSAASRSAS